MSTIKPAETVVSQRFPRVFLFDMERCVYQMSTILIYLHSFFRYTDNIFKIYNFSLYVRVVMLFLYLVANFL